MTILQVLDTPEASSRALLQQYVEIVGTNRSDLGRQCECHADGCGRSLCIGSLARFRNEVIINGHGQEEEVISAYTFEAGIESCRVGFLPWHLKAKKAEYVGKVVQVISLEDLSDSKNDCCRSHRYGGIVVAVLIQ